MRRAVARDDSWRLAWSDEFDNDGAPDADKWSIDVWPAKKVNDEDQAYTPREKNLRVRDGMLIIEAHKEDYEGASYTSGRVHTQGNGDFLYGRIEVRAKLPQGIGVWPAIWMLPSDPFNYATTCEEGEDWQGSETCDAWPNSGEIDIMENVGYDVNRIHALGAQPGLLLGEMGTAQRPDHRRQFGGTVSDLQSSNGPRRTSGSSSTTICISPTSTKKPVGNHGLTISPST